MSYSYLDTFDEKLNNILKIKSDHYDEACILMFVFLEFLSNFVDKQYPSSNARYNGANFRNFLSEYSGCESILKYIQVEKFLNDKAIIHQPDYKQYIDKIESSLIRVEDGEDLPISSFLNIDDIVDPAHIKYFQKITIFNKIYDLRNLAVHNYRNEIDKGIDALEPVLSYTQNIEEVSEGWFNTYIPFDFMYMIVGNCYKKVREEYKDFADRFFSEEIL
ncbi:hypothetical protein A3844_18860 [Paenibacillus helianthi]|uniref:RiboL-PSP-HEPN domain-containing protein n=1 Tax=Paenibacillus helianthi TaxID=1349432 RepID=A0ABX3EK93_9BACL|nr:hypothetical protein [Paenibacillus helianthi]OKP84846.1 hypothetical protein A3844_18860 [Paenibacillus helianthi]